MLATVARRARKTAMAMRRPRSRARRLIGEAGAGGGEGRRWGASERHAPLPVSASDPSAARKISSSDNRSRGNLGRDAASVEDEHAVGQIDELGNLGRMEAAPPRRRRRRRGSGGRVRSWCRRRCRESGRTAGEPGFQQAAIWRWRSSADCRRRTPQLGSKAPADRRRRVQRSPRPPQSRADHRSEARG